MKTNQDIYDEVFEILGRRGFEMWRAGGPHYTIRYGQQWWLDLREICNWILK